MDTRNTTFPGARNFLGGCRMAPRVIFFNGYVFLSCPYIHRGILEELKLGGHTPYFCSTVASSRCEK